MVHPQLARILVFHPIPLFLPLPLIFLYLLEIELVGLDGLILIEVSFAGVVPRQRAERERLWFVVYRFLIDLIEGKLMVEAVDAQLAILGSLFPLLAIVSSATGGRQRRPSCRWCDVS